MHWDDRLLLNRLDIRTDGIFRVMCPHCGKAPIRVDHRAKQVHCPHCEKLVDKPYWAWAAHYVSCASCRAFAVRVSDSSPRCTVCQARWEEDGKPYENLRVYMRLGFPIDWATVPRIDVMSMAKAAVAIRKAEGETDSEVPQPEDS